MKPAQAISKEVESLAAEDAPANTDELLRSLAESVAVVLRRHRDSERRISLNSFVAYVLFTVLLGGGFALLYHSRVGGLVKAQQSAIAERDAARERAEQLHNEVGRRDAAAKSAFRYYELIREKRRTEVISQHSQIESLDLSPTEREFFADAVARARSEMIDAGYLAGLDAFRRGDHKRAISEFERGLAYETEGQQAALMRYYMGVAQLQVGDEGKAVRNLELALAGRVDESGIADARYYLALAFERMGSADEARKEYGKFANAAPTSPRAALARRKAAQLARLIARGSAAGSAAGGGATPTAPGGAAASPAKKSAGAAAPLRKAAPPTASKKPATPAKAAAEPAAATGEAAGEPAAEPPTPD